MTRWCLRIDHPDEDTQRRGALIIVICLSFLGVCFASIPLIFMGDIGDPVRSAFIFTLNFLIIFMGMFLARRGRVRVAGFLTPLGMSVIVHTSVWASHGLNFFLFFSALTPFLTALLSHRKFVLVQTLLNLALLWCVAWWMPYFSNHTALHKNFVPVLSLMHLSTGALSYLYSQINDRFFESLLRAKRELTVAKQAAIDANLAKSRFLANMSHELRTPLNAILGYSEILIEESDFEEDLQLQRDASRINRSGRHLLMLINGLLDLAKIESGKMTMDICPTPLCDLIEEVQLTMEPLIEEKHNRFVLDLAISSEAIVATDPVKLKQILLNLLSNASKFTREGEIRLTVRRSTDGEWALFEVSDTGIGIPKAQQEHIFEDFVQASPTTTREYGGTGLGLSLCIRLSEMMEGHMSLESEEGIGSTFCFHLPSRLVTAPASGSLEEEEGL